MQSKQNKPIRGCRWSVSLRLALKSLKSHIKTAIVQMICLFMGMVIIAFFIGQYSYAENDINSIDRYVDPGRIIYMDNDIFIEGHKTPPELIEKLTEDYKGLEGLMIYQRAEPQQLYTDYGYVFSTVNTVWFYGKQVFKEDENCDFTLLEDNTCIVGSAAANENRLFIGNSLYIDNSEFIIAGITENPLFDNNILIKDNGAVAKSRNIDVFLLFIPDTIPDLTQFQNYVSKNFKTFNSLSGEKWIENHRGMLREGWDFTITMCILALFYSFFVIFNILKLNIRRDSMQMAIKLACGSEYKDIYRQKMFEVLIITFFSILLTAAVLPMLSMIAEKNGIYILETIKVYAITYIIVSAVELILLKLLLRRMKMSCVSDLFREAKYYG